VSVAVITRNEAAHVEACLRSVAWADERLVIDCGSTDDTVARAERAGARVLVREWPGYAAQKNFAASEARHDWILSVDADERVTPALADEIRARLTTEPAESGFRIPRVTFRARWRARRVHESVAADGTVGLLTQELQHFAYRDISHHLATMDRYTTLAAEEMFEAGRRAGVLDLVAHPPAAFLRNYVLKGGFRDGVPGLIVSAMNAQYVFLKFAKLWERARASRQVTP
jgi:glycosyltransferase involved in cell wall biosynthesis